MKEELRKSMFGGYPHVGIKSQETFPNRIPTRIVEEKVMALIDAKFYPDWSKCENDSQKVDFLLDRIHDYNIALGLAEQQLKDIAAEYPFIPQDFNFVETDEKFGGDGFQPQCYKRGKYLIARVDDHCWFIAGIGKVMLSNSQMAFIVLRSLGIISDEEFSQEEIHSVSSAEITPEEISLAKEMNAYKEGFHNGQKAVIQPVPMNDFNEDKEVSDGE